MNNKCGTNLCNRDTNNSNKVYVLDSNVEKQRMQDATVVYICWETYMNQTGCVAPLREALRMREKRDIPTPTLLSTSSTAFLLLGVGEPVEKIIGNN